jgi:hypothetical protein
MKRVLFVLALVLVAAFAFSGCGKKAEATVPCAGGCGMELTKADAKVIDGKSYCAGCAAHLADELAKEAAVQPAPAPDLIKCAGGCGMELAKSDATEIEGKYYCSDCAAKAREGH